MLAVQKFEPELYCWSKARTASQRFIDCACCDFVLSFANAEPLFFRDPREMLAFFLAAVLSYLLATEGWAHKVARPGCHLHSFNVTVRSDRQGTCRGARTLQACVGYCESSAFPSKYSVLLASDFKRNVTSASQCCTIRKMQKVKLRLRCGLGPHKTMDIFTAKTCQCDMCRLSRY
ncbi:glycoprotein hormone alpha-2 [Candoia aspera]|uniref:glycoprotein hormone alpha-2 n=1 Tax=Candoia aspera TaxID=51853 RepID=UPI002FD86C0D